MRGALCAILSTAFLLALVAAVGAACLPLGDPCCGDDFDCAEGARCFEGRCAPRCDDEADQADAQCDEGERCVAGAGVCRAIDPEVELGRCQYDDDRGSAP